MSKSGHQVYPTTGTPCSRRSWIASTERSSHEMRSATDPVTHVSVSITGALHRAASQVLWRSGLTRLIRSIQVTICSRGSCRDSHRCLFRTFFFRSEETDSIAALSAQELKRPIDRLMPLSRHSQQMDAFV